ncbi:hypothetical protein AB0E55_41515, partial [Amycolatopsis keratiniphila]|uniref:hypothetical protein n=1 Tax=Amycolatopsis keratiniphila TaxID=129921 RepID=UPI0033D9AAF7
MQAYLDTLVLPKGIYFGKSDSNHLNTASAMWLRRWVQDLATEKDDKGKRRYKPKDILALGGKGFLAGGTVYRWIGAAREAVSDTGAEGVVETSRASGESDPAVVATMEDVARWRPGPDGSAGPQTLRAYLDTLALPEGISFARGSTKLNNASVAWLREWVQSLAKEKADNGKWSYTTTSIRALGGDGLLGRHSVARWSEAVRDPVAPAVSREEPGGRGSADGVFPVSDAASESVAFGNFQESSAAANAGFEHGGSSVSSQVGQAASSYGLGATASAGAVLPRRSASSSDVATKEHVVRWRPGPANTIGPQTLRAYLETLVLPEGTSFDRSASVKLTVNSMAWLREWVDGLAVEKDDEGEWLYAAKEILALGGKGLLAEATVYGWIKAKREAVSDTLPDRDLPGGVAGGSNLPADVIQDAEEVRTQRRKDSRVAAIEQDELDELPHLPAQASQVGQSESSYGAWTTAMENFDFDDMMDTLPEWLSATQADASGSADIASAGTVPLWPSIPSDPMGARAWVDGGGGLSRRFGESSVQEIESFLDRASRIVSRFPWVPAWGENPGTHYADAAVLRDAVKDILAAYLVNGLSEQDAERLVQELATKLGSSPVAQATLLDREETGTYIADEPRLSGSEESPRGPESGVSPAVAKIEDIAGWRPDPAGTAGGRTLKSYLETLLLPRGISFDRSAGDRLNSDSVTWLRTWVQNLAVEKDSQRRWRYHPRDIVALGGRGLLVFSTVQRWTREAREAEKAHLASSAVAKIEDVVRWRPDPVDAAGPKTLLAYLNTLNLPEGVSFDRVATKLNDVARDWLLAWVQGMAAEKGSEGQWLYSTDDIVALDGWSPLNRESTRKRIDAVRKPAASAQPFDEPSGLGSPTLGQSVHGSESSSAVARMEDVVRWRPDPLDVAGPRTFRDYLNALVLPVGINFLRSEVYLNNNSTAWLRSWVKSLAEEKDSEGQWRYDPEDILTLGGNDILVAKTVKKWTNEARKAAVDAEVGGIEVGGARLAPSGSAPVAVA